MDWKECLKKRIVKEVRKDYSLINSTKDIAKIKIESAEALPPHLFIGKITLFYDALRSYLEALALENGYKIYNHECYTSFLKEVLGLSREAEMFDKVRRIRNGINYYGRKVDGEEAKEVIRDLLKLIRIVKDKLE